MASDKARMDWYDANKDTATYMVYRQMRFAQMTVRQAIDASMKSERLARRTARPKKAGGKP